ncbi:hypothetical protein PM023_16830 [Halorubrum ezzemoulense]|uniref:hypothetical protein n=1 Tax=Halorubrum ezzemoulense TaxID=337243 RepID=UPI00232B367A|nr:hypothetical protein [Halorubrum ezzemoulense]MDB2226303.1 hypothetical protein [Halorubrum ezzemoulense]
MVSVLDKNRPGFLADTNLFQNALFLTILLVPVIRLAGIPISPLFLFLPFCLRFILPKPYFLAGFLGIGVLSVMTALNVVRNPVVSASDFTYFAIPLIYTFFIGLSITVFQRVRDNRAYLVWLFRIWLAVQTLFVVIQFLNPLGVNNLLEPVMRFLAANVGPSASYGNSPVLSNRPGGLITVSTWFGMATYIVGRFLATYTKSYAYIVWATALALLASARMTLLTIAATEFILLLYLYRHDKLPFDPKNGIIAAVPLGIALLAIGYHHPYLDRFVVAALSGDLIETLAQTRSIQHRIDSYSYLFSRPEMFFIGGLVVADVPFSFDSELVMRTAQFSFLGYLALKFPILIFLIRAIRRGDTEMTQYAITLTSIAFLSSLTMGTSSNMIFIVLFSVLIGAAELIHYESHDDKRLPC